MAAILTGNTGFGNRGVEALFLPIVQNVRRIRPELAIRVLTHSPELDALRIDDDNTTTEKDRFQQWGRLARTPKLARPIFERVAPGLHAQAEAVRTADAVIVSGGDLFGSDYGFRMHLPPLERAVDAGRPVIFCAHSIGPFKTQEEIDRFLAVARRSAMVTLRESLSYKYVTETLGLKNDTVALTGDTAFLLDPVSREQAEMMLASYGVDLDRPAVCMSISQAIAKYTSSDAQRHFDSWMAMIRHSINELGAQVVLVPHVQSGMGDNDDRVIQTRIMHAMGWDPRVKLLGADHTASEFKAMVRRCGYIIAERMHAAIGALSLCTPTTAVQYSVKAEGIMKDLLGDDPVSMGGLITSQDLADPSKAVACLDTAWRNKDRIEETLNTSVPEMKKRSSENFERLAQIIGAKANASAA